MSRELGYQRTRPVGVDDTALEVVKVHCRDEVESAGCPSGGGRGQGRVGVVGGGVVIALAVAVAEAGANGTGGSGGESAVGEQRL